LINQTYKKYCIIGQNGIYQNKIFKRNSVNNQIISKGLIPESLIWNLITKDGFVIKYINQVLQIYHIWAENSLSSINIVKTA
jgi:hypothetical protein